MITSCERPLSTIKAGESVKLTSIHSGKKLKKRLIDLGLVVGTVIQVIHSDGTGRMIIGVRHESRLALGQGMASKIMVSCVPCPYEVQA